MCVCVCVCVFVRACVRTLWVWGKNIVKSATIISPRQQCVFSISSESLEMIHLLKWKMVKVSPYIPYGIQSFWQLWPLFPLLYNKPVQSNTFFTSLGSIQPCWHYCTKPTQLPSIPLHPISCAPDSAYAPQGAHCPATTPQLLASLHRARQTSCATEQ